MSIVRAATPSSGGAQGRWWRGLAARATLIGAGMLAALSMLLIAINATAAYRTAEAAIETRVAAGADGLAVRLEGGELATGEFVEAAAAAGFDYAWLQTASGAHVAGLQPGADRPDFSADRIGETREATISAVTSGGGVAYAAKALSIGGEQMTVVVGLSLESARAASSEAVIQGLIAAIAFLALALPILAALVDRAASPLRALTRAVTVPGASQQEVRAAGDRSDEVGALARAHLTIARDLARNADALHHLTFEDSLTRLPNRASLTSRLAAALQLGEPLALLHLDVQGLSRIAAGLGQQSGDEAVRRAADRLSETAMDWARDASTPEDRLPVLARMSDTGFALFARGADASVAKALADAALNAFETPLFVGEHHVSTTLAVGVALAPEDGDEAGAFLRSAAAAVSAARAAGPQSIRFAGAELNRVAYSRLKLEQDLRRAIEHGELELHYQPQIALRTGVVSGAEALVRWRHPIRGLVSPMEFVPVAEECGLIEPLGRFVLGQAGRMAADWHARGMPIRIAVNVSAIQFRRQRFADETLEIIGASGADASQIELEITESAAMRDAGHAARELAPLKSAGIRVAIDDFGTGFSNLSSLTQLPFDVLKIDRAFVRDAATAAGARAVVGAVMGLAKNLGFETVAEGVETEDQLAFVTAQGCTHVQGYLFAKPMASDAFEAWYAARLVSNLRTLAEHRKSAETTRPADGLAAAFG